MKKDYKELKVGREFDISEYDGKRLLLREWTRSIVTVSVLLGCLVALGIAALMFDQTALLGVWGAVSMPIGGVVGYYLRGSKQSAESDD